MHAPQLPHRLASPVPRVRAPGCRGSRLGRRRLMSCCGAQSGPTPLERHARSLPEGTGVSWLTFACQALSPRTPNRRLQEGRRPRMHLSAARSCASGSGFRVVLGIEEVWALAGSSGSPVISSGDDAFPDVHRCCRRCAPDDTGASARTPQGRMFPEFPFPSSSRNRPDLIFACPTCQAQGQLSVFDGSSIAEKAAFVSHQWVSQGHPDPDFRQMSVLQDALRKFLSSGGPVPKDQLTEIFTPAAEPLPMHEFQTCSLFIWYDYFSVPQLEARNVHTANITDTSDGSNQGYAIQSIPAYVAK